MVDRLHLLPCFGYVSAHEEWLECVVIRTLKLQLTALDGCREDISHLVVLCVQTCK